MTEFWRKWLLAAAVVTAVAGAGIAAMATAGAMDDTVFELIYLPGGLDAPAGDIAHFAVGLMGAVMAGWAVMMLVLLINRSAATLPTTWWALTLGLATWFVLDCAVSIAAGAFGNLVVNVAFVALFAPALVATRPERESAQIVA